MKIIDEAGNSQERAPVAQREPRTQGGAPDADTGGGLPLLQGQREAGEDMGQLLLSLRLGEGGWRDGKKSCQRVSLSR